MHELSVDLGERSYPIRIGAGVRNHLRATLEALQPKPRQIAIIADERVWALHSGALDAEIPDEKAVLTFVPGEASKSLDCAATIYGRLASTRIDRNDLITTFGGGVAGDLGGFVAATWLRGVRFIQIPTTLEAAIDASVGGKTAVNLPTGKNLVGAFHQPVAVIVDTEFIETLPQRDFVAGLGESVKHAAIRDPQFLEWHETEADRILARDPTVLTGLIARNCQIKADVVARDEREQGLRAILNFGHTLGHAIEHLLEYEYRHGECVSLGMIAANRIAVERGLLPQADAERIRALLSRLGLPVCLPRALEETKVVEVCRRDKKAVSVALVFVLLNGLGRPVVVKDGVESEVRAGLRAVEPATAP